VESCDLLSTPPSRCVTRHPKRVLIVEDAPVIRDIIAHALRTAGHEITTAEDGVDGLRKFRAGEWDLVITDMHMPRMNGDEMAAVIKVEAPSVPVIMVTASMTMLHDPDVFYAFVAKPFRRRDLAELVDAAPSRRSVSA
jgi:two-component system copper resistance phosphate regulon response regulator CusR